MSGIYAPSCSCSKNGRMKIKKIYVGRKNGMEEIHYSTFNKELHMDKKRCCLLPMQD